MNRGSIITWLVLLAVVDVVVPVPILAITLLVVVFRRPPWFLEMVRTVYEAGPPRR